MALGQKHEPQIKTAGVLVVSEGTLVSQLKVSNENEIQQTI